MSRRLQKELLELKNNGTPVGIKLLKADDFQSWVLSVEVLGETLYKGEVFALRFQFDQGYPISAPAVTFVVDEQYQAPVHPHVYSNGHICASTLGSDWSPVLTVSAVCITIQSMLASAKQKIRPPDNDRYIARAPDNPKKTRWDFHGMYHVIQRPDPLNSTFLGPLHLKTTMYEYVMSQPRWNYPEPPTPITVFVDKGYRSPCMY